MCAGCSLGPAASQIRIRLPDAGRTHVEIEAGAADIADNRSTRGVAARIENDSFLNFTSIDSTAGSRSWMANTVRRTTSTAENRVDIEIGAGAASVTVG